MDPEVKELLHTCATYNLENVDTGDSDDSDDSDDSSIEILNYPEIQNRPEILNDPEVKELLYSCANYNLENGERDDLSMGIIKEIDDAVKQ